MKKQKLRLSAYHPKADKYVDLEYFSIRQAKYFNPSLINFKIKGWAKEQK